jgi:hypothetical protein|tara:strand:- start:278 stop:496 length:219 start_codon:yes stop_codon:yes gene_type:complete
MKKILSIIVVSLLLSSNVYADCKNDIKFTWSKGVGNQITFQFDNNGSKHIRITRIYVADSDGDKIDDIKPKT